MNVKDHNDEPEKHQKHNGSATFKVLSFPWKNTISEALQLHFLSFGSFGGCKQEVYCFNRFYELTVGYSLSFFCLNLYLSGK